MFKLNGQLAKASQARDGDQELADDTSPSLGKLASQEHAPPELAGAIREAFDLPKP